MNRDRLTYAQRKQQEEQRAWERAQIRRLLWVLLLFLTIFVGKQVEPGRIWSAGERVIQSLSHHADLKAVFARLGESIAGEGGALEGLGEFCVEVFGPQSKSEMPEVEKTAVMQPVFPAAYVGLLAEELHKDENHNEDIVFEQAVRETESVPAVGTVLYTVEEGERTFPEGYTANKLSFGGLKTVSPVLGHLNSGFGYRDHPVKGNYSFHGGADISAAQGDPIGAFADGIVEYVGEDDTYGLYFQVDHGNEIKSFYAHCQRVCVQKGQQVRAGEQVAVVGATGRTTGPHLHLELKCCGVRVDPAYYIQFL